MRWAFFTAVCLLISLPAVAATPDDVTTAALPSQTGAVDTQGALGTVDLNPPPALTGPEVYHQNCVACHGADGHGVVAGTPDFTQAGGVLSKSDATLIQHIAQGYQSPGSPLAMPARAGNPGLTDAEIAEVVRYLHTAFGSQGTASSAGGALDNQAQAGD
jgi:mono/diheme cytochrome c family protein